MFFKLRSLPPHLRDQRRWIEMAQETRPIERAGAEEAVATLYALAGLPAPRFRWFPSPRAAIWAMCGRDLEACRLARSAMSSKLRHEPAAGRWRRIRGRLSDPLWREISLLTTQALSRRVADCLLRPLEGEIACLTSGLAGSAHFHGQLDAHWLAFYSACRDCGVRYGAKDDLVLEAWIRQAERCFLWWPLPELCLLSERPVSLSLDEEGRLHAELRPAVSFGDGWEIFCIAGQRVPPEIGRSRPEEWCLETLLGERTLCAREALLERIGYERMARELPKTRLDSWREYSLFRIEARIGSEPVHVLFMTCPSTGRQHVTRVHPSVRTAREAATWMNSGIDPSSLAVEH